jgi:transcriptional regulator with XRE-family HTH domain
MERKVRSHVRAVIEGQAGERAELAARVILADIEKAQAAQTDWRPPADRPCLSEIVALRIRLLRNALGMNRAELSARFNDLSSDVLMTEHVLTNIESGRVTNGSRRRMVTVDEVVVFAKALGVTPAALMDPASTGAMAVITALKSARGGVL